MAMDSVADAEGDQTIVAKAAAVGSSPSSPPRSRPGNRSAASRSFDCRQTLGAVLCSHVGVAIVLSAYFAMGAFLFRALESPAEMEALSRLARVREESLEGIWRLGVVTWQDGGEGTDQTKANFTDGLKELLRKYQGQIVGWRQGRTPAAVESGFEPDADVVRWSFVGALLYSVTIVTTVGYGHVTPRTGWGRLLTIVYGLIGIPLMVVYLWKMGGLLAEAFRIFYQRVCCDLCCCKRCERARRRRRSATVYMQSPSTTSGTYASSYRVGYSSRRGRPPGGPAVESPVESSTDPTQGLIAPSENLEFMRGGGASEGGGAATCVNMAFHGSLPRSISRANRDWRAQSSHVYETISLIDDVNAGHVVTKTPRPRSYAAGRTADGRVHYGKGATAAAAWSAEGHEGSVKGGQAERDRTLERRSGGGGGVVESPRERKTDRKASDERSASLPRPYTQRRASQGTKTDRKPSSRNSTVDATITTNSLGRTRVSTAAGAPPPATAVGSDRTMEGKPSSSTSASLAKQKRPMVTRRPVVTSSPRTLRGKTTTAPAITLDGRRQKPRSQNNNHQTSTAGKNSSASDRHPKKGYRRRGGAPGGGAPEDCPNGVRSSQLGQSDESFVTALDDSSSEDVGSTDTGSAEDETGPTGRRKFSHLDEPRKKKKRLGSGKHSKRGTEKGERGGKPSAVPPANSIDDGSTEPAKTSVDHVESQLDVIYSASDDDYAAYTSSCRRKPPVPICACIMVLVTYVFAGSLGFCLWEGWDYATGPYFCFVTLSTVGFGDFVPGAEPSRSSASTEKLLVCTVWLLLGMTLLAMCAILITEHFGGRRQTITSSTNYSSRR